MNNTIEERIEFWIFLWEDLIGNFLKKSYGLSLYSPRTIIEDIIIEIEENGFRNNDNKKFLYSKLDQYSKHDKVIAEKFNSNFKILRQIFNSNRTSYILEASKTINRKFEKGLYFDNALDRIVNLIMVHEKNNNDYISELRYLSQNVIIELLKKGYVLEDIKNFLSNNFSSYKISKIEGIEYIITKYPHEIDSEIFLDSEGNFNQSAYNKSIVKILEELTPEKRINALKKYYYKTEERAF